MFSIWARAPIVPIDWQNFFNTYRKLHTNYFFKSWVVKTNIFPVDIFTNYQKCIVNTFVAYFDHTYPGFSQNINSPISINLFVILTPFHSVVTYFLFQSQKRYRYVHEKPQETPSFMKRFKISLLRLSSVLESQSPGSKVAHSENFLLIEKESNYIPKTINVASLIECLCCN